MAVVAAPPTLEELLLAWAYLDTGEADKAKVLWAKATARLDGAQEAAPHGPRRCAAGGRAAGTGIAISGADPSAQQRHRLGDLARTRRAPPRAGPALYATEAPERLALSHSQETLKFL